MPESLVPYSRLRKMADEELDERYARSILNGDQGLAKYLGVEVDRRVRDQGRALARTAIVRAEKAIRWAALAAIAAAVAAIAGIAGLAMWLLHGARGISS